MSIIAMKQAVEVLMNIEQVVDLRSRWRNADDKRMDVIVEDALTALRIAIAEAEKVEPVGSVTVSPWRGLENIEWQQQADIPEGTHMLYLAAGAQP